MIINVYIILLVYRTRKTHPGAVIHLSDNPVDISKVSTFSEVINTAVSVWVAS